MPIQASTGFNPPSLHSGTNVSQNRTPCELEAASSGTTGFSSSPSRTALEPRRSEPAATENRFAGDAGSRGLCRRGNGPRRATWQRGRPSGHAPPNEFQLSREIQALRWLIAEEFVCLACCKVFRCTLTVPRCRHPPFGVLRSTRGRELFLLTGTPGFGTRTRYRFRLRL